MTNLNDAYAQAIALHQALETLFANHHSPEHQKVVDQADDLVRAIGRRLNAN